jgi:hypothetical protein
LCAASTSSSISVLSSSDIRAESSSNAHRPQRLFLRKRQRIRFCGTIQNVQIRNRAANFGKTNVSFDEQGNVAHDRRINRQRTIKIVSFFRQKRLQIDFGDENRLFEFIAAAISSFKRPAYPTFFRQNEISPIDLCANAKRFAAKIQASAKPAASSAASSAPFKS